MHILRNVARYIATKARVFGLSNTTTRFYNRSRKPLSPRKQAELNLLCEALLQKKELIASGKLQLIGLTKIRKRLGKRWKGLAEVVYEVVEDVLRVHLNKSTDFFVRYHEENYLIFFSKSTLEESRRKCHLIASDIQQRLFELGDDALRELEIRQCVKTLADVDPHSFDYQDFLESFPSLGSSTSEMLGIHPELDDDHPLHPEIPSIDIAAEDYIAHDGPHLSEIPLPKVSFGYKPVWDVKRNALNTYICFPHSVTAPKASFAAFSELYRPLSETEIAAMDVATLHTVHKKLKEVQAEQKKVLIVSPVQYSTLHNYHTFHQYKEVLQTIHPKLKAYLVLYVMDMVQEPPEKDPYWFVKPLKPLCRHVFAEVPLRPDINFSYLRNQHIDAIGFRMNDLVSSKLNTASLLNLFQARAHAHKIPLTFVFDVNQIDDSVTAFTEYDYVCGGLIHPAVKEIEGAKPFHSEDVLLKLLGTYSM